MVYQGEIRTDTHGDSEIIDITDQVVDQIAQSGIRAGICTVFVPGSTGAITTIEFEPGVISDLREAIDRIAPQNIHYRHDQAWGDGNGHSHVRAALLGPSFTVPVRNGEAVLGTWQQIVFIDFDNRPRSRKLAVHVLGE